MDKITFSEDKIQIDMDTLISAMSTEERFQLLKRFCVDIDIINIVIDYICDNDKDGWFIGDASNIRQNLLIRVEAKQLEQMPELLWSPWEELRQKLKDIRFAEHIYWHLYHKLPEALSNAVFVHFRENGIENNYTTNSANADIARIEQLIKDTMSACKK